MGCRLNGGSFLKNITILTIVYNEEDRIEDFLGSFSWSNDIILVDKSSTDKTIELAMPYNPTIITVPYTDEAARLSNLGLAAAKNDWVMMATASDVIHPKLAAKLLQAINTEDFEYDVISMPYSIYVFGIKDKRSPWYNTRENKLARKSAIRFSDRVHEERGTSSTKVYYLPENEEEALLHLTHRNLDIFFEHHLRYCRLETQKYSDPSELKKAWREVLQACKLVFLKKRTYRLGEDGLALGIAYISYFIMKYLFIWQKFRGRGEVEYARIKEELARIGDSKIKDQAKGTENS